MRKISIYQPALAATGSATDRGCSQSTYPYATVCIAIFVLFCAVRCGAQISPGPLSRPHQSLEGGANCTKCHAVSTRSPEFRCTECHKEIADELQRNRGLHASYPRSSVPGAACVKCHSDHNGADFQMVHWNPAPGSFDHSKTGYNLDGKHTGVTCRACHTAQHIPAQARALLAGKDLNRTWFGLTPSCINCHQDKHQGRFGTDCVRCHSTLDWKSATVDRQNFDHSKTQFPLTGQHRYVLCQSCHTPGPDNMPRYSSIKFANCADCHRDPHKGAFKQGCDSCHSTTTWKKSTFASTFDHSKTHFALLGKHVDIPCVSCHKGGDFKTPIAHNNCADCHKDEHNGQFAKRSDGGRCESCHNVQGWSPSTFTVADHAKTGFPLTFPHTAVKCSSCHTPVGKDAKFKIKFAQCVDCHKDEHNGQFAAAPWSNRCEQCHSGATFKTTSFTLEKHQKSNFPLSGGHIAVACNDCHKALAGTKVIPFHFENLSCTSCHEDVHKGQFASRVNARDASGKAAGCQACHSTKDWKDLSKFDHAQTQFPLIGSHRAVACADCHKPPNMELTLIHVQFSSAPTKCSECHENPHGEQFGARMNNCAGCHNSNKWRPSLFDHSKTAFPLTGGHEEVACAKCHTVKKQVNGVEVLFYKPTPTACSDCHGNNVPKAQANSAINWPAPQNSSRLHPRVILAKFAG
jgi:hypothetical protein